jgi:DNA-binding NarL/FixJ family response regulator/anti-sigma regulatory factor (Ser/Thr protein kinase)
MTTARPRERALLIDDAEDLRFLLRRLLEGSGRYEVVGEAGDGERGVEEARTTAPDLVLLDLSMPRMDGLEALPLLQRVAPDARVVVLSGFAEGQTAEAALAAGASAYIEKGLAPEALLARIDEATSPGHPAPAVVPRTALPDPAPPAAPALLHPLAQLLGADVRAMHAALDALGPAEGDDRRAKLRRRLADVDRVVDGTRRYAEAGIAPLSLRGIEVAEAVTTTARALGRQDAVVGPPRNGLRVLADARRLEDVLEQVVENVFRHGGSRVEVAAWRDRDEVVLTFADDGPGFGDALDHAFRPLEQGPRARREGTARGYGLAIVGEAARRMSGAVTAQDAPRGGAVVTLRLPAA